MDDFFFGYVAWSLYSTRMRVRMMRSLMEELWRQLTDEERRGAEALGAPHLAEAARFLDEHYAELSESLQLRLPWHLMDEDWGECNRVAQFLQHESSRQYAALRMSSAPIRELVLDAYSLLASSAQIVREATDEARYMLYSVLEHGQMPVEPAVTLPPVLDPPEDEPVDPDPDLDPPLPVPPGVNPIAFALDEERKRWDRPDLLTESDEIHVAIAAGRYRGLAVGLRAWAPIDRYEPWWGKARMVIHGRGMGKTTIAAANDAPWGASLVVKPNPDWGGRLVLTDVTIECSGSNAIEAGVYGVTEKVPLEELSLERVEFVDHPNPAIKCVRPVSVNQARFTATSCIWRCPNSKEHAVYERNCFGQRGMFRCIVIGVGGQVWQSVNRTAEGPDYGPGLVLLEDCIFRGFHRWPERAGSAVTQAGNGATVVVRRCTISDVDRVVDEPPDGPRSHGAHVTWSGGDHYPTVSGAANAGVSYFDCDIVLRDSDRGPMAFSQVRTVVLDGCGIYASNGTPVRVGEDRLEWKDSVAELTIRNCNTPEVRQRCLDKGFDEALLVDVPVYFGSNKEDFGPLSSLQLEP